MALQPTELTVPKGALFGLLGQNGAGKTTLQRMIATVLAPTSGSIIVAGHDTVAAPFSVRRALGVLPELWGLYARLTVRENLWYQAQLHGLDRDSFERELGRLAAALEMEEFLDRRAGKLSKGMRQKAAYARALVHTPDVVLLDEPTSGLDVLAAQAVRTHLRSIAGRCTVIVSTHVMTLAEDVCDTVALLHKGQLRYVGPKEQLVKEHGSLRDGFLQLVGADPDAGAAPGGGSDG